MNNDATTLAYMYQTMYYTKEGGKNSIRVSKRRNVHQRRHSDTGGKDGESKCTMARTGWTGGAMHAEIGGHGGIMRSGGS